MKNNQTTSRVLNGADSARPFWGTTAEMQLADDLRGGAWVSSDSFGPEIEELVFRLRARGWKIDCEKFLSDRPAMYFLSENNPMALP